MGTDSCKDIVIPALPLIRRSVRGLCPGTRHSLALPPLDQPLGAQSKGSAEHFNSGPNCCSNAEPPVCAHSFLLPGDPSAATALPRIAQNLCPFRPRAGPSKVQRPGPRWLSTPPSCPHECSSSLTHTHLQAPARAAATFGFLHKVLLTPRIASQEPGNQHPHPDVCSHLWAFLRDQPLVPPPVQSAWLATKEGLSVGSEDSTPKVVAGGAGCRGSRKAGGFKGHPPTASQGRERTPSTPFPQLGIFLSHWCCCRPGHPPSPHHLRLDSLPLPPELSSPLPTAVNPSAPLFSLLAGLLGDTAGYNKRGREG